jgi:cell pole-organizing protein PopZ
MQISKATENGVKKNISMLIENVKQQVLKEKEERQRIISTHEKTLEQFVKEMLQPAIVEYLDKNLEGIVNKVVEGEIKRITDDIEDSK